MTVILSLLATIGIMALTGTAIKVPTQILPSFLLAVGVGTSVHILAIFYRRLQQTEDKEEAIAYALGHSGLAVVMTNVTTACGLMSFSTSEVAPVADLGLFAGIGVLLTFVNTLVLLPAVIALLPIRVKKSEARSEQAHPDGQISRQGQSFFNPIPGSHTCRQLPDHGIVVGGGIAKPLFP